MVCYHLLINGQLTEALQCLTPITINLLIIDTKIPIKMSGLFNINFQ